MGQKARAECRRIRRAFRPFDRDGSGQITAAALLAILTRSDGGAALTLEDAREIVADFDRSGTGKLSIDEFSEACAVIGLGGGGGGDEGGDDDEPLQELLEAALLDAMEADEVDAAPAFCAPADWARVDLRGELQGVMAWVPAGTRVDLPMVHGPQDSFSLSVLEAEESEACLQADVESAAAEFRQRNSQVSAMVQETLADGYLITAVNKGPAGDNFWVLARRELMGMAFAVESTTRSREQQMRVVQFARGLHLDEKLCS